jgi:hypothetical protein
MARWITVTVVPFDYKWPNRTAITAFTKAGEFFVKDEVADFAVGKGFATEGKTRTKKAGKKAAKERAPVQTADDGRRDRVDRSHVADHDRPADLGAVASDAG